MLTPVAEVSDPYLGSRQLSASLLSGQESAETLQYQRAWLMNPGKSDQSPPVSKQEVIRSTSPWHHFKVHVCVSTKTKFPR